ncbi:MAG: AbgT family transporter [Candidatus Nanopelagicales bacterium]
MSDATAVEEKKDGGGSKVLDFIARTGDKVPHPAIIFLVLCLFVIVLSHVLYLFGVSVTSEIAEPPPVAGEPVYPGGSQYPGVEYPPGAGATPDYEIQTETISVQSLLTGDGLRFLFTSPVSNFNGFGVVGVILVAMVGVGIAEQAGLIGALIRKLVAVAPEVTITYILVLLGLVSSIASDAGYLVLIPLGAAAFASIGRNPLGGMAAAYAGVSAGFGVNLLITPFDGVLTEVTNEAARLVQPDFEMSITANLFFSAASTIFLVFVMTFVTHRFVMPRLGGWDGVHDEVEEGPEVDAASEARGLRWALWAFLASVVVLLVLILPSNAVLRNPETGELIGDSPFMQSILVIITLMFLVAGVAYGKGAGTITKSTGFIEAVIKTFAGLAGLIFLLLIISQFIAYFNYSNMATVAAVGMADWLESAQVPALVLLVGFILVTFLLNIIIPGVLPKWAIFAPVFVPLFLRLGVEPQTVLAAYRIGDSPTNVITPLMVYLPFIVLIAQRYKKDAGVGTIIALMIPYTIWVAILWTLFFVVWFLLGIPLGPGAPVSG